jgi:cytochrome b subunit of formate dehydrogenase
MTVAGVLLMLAGLAMFLSGFAYHPDSRSRSRINVATIAFAYVGLVLALTSKLVESSAP